MFQELMTLRDFMTEEELKFLPGRLQAGTFILLEQNRSEKEKLSDGKTLIKNFERVIQVFTSTGTYIGEITKPSFIPQQK